jgi:hypothetical protein
VTQGAEQSIRAPDHQHVEPAASRVSKHPVETGSPLAGAGHTVIDVRVRELPSATLDHRGGLVGLQVLLLIDG